jgi:hypothetical protein
MRQEVAVMEMQTVMFYEKAARAVRRRIRPRTVREAGRSGKASRGPRAGSWKPNTLAATSGPRNSSSSTASSSSSTSSRPDGPHRRLGFDARPALRRGLCHAEQSRDPSSWALRVARRGHQHGHFRRRWPTTARFPGAARRGCAASSAA